MNSEKDWRVKSLLKCCDSISHLDFLFIQTRYHYSAMDPSYEGYNERTHERTTDKNERIVAQKNKCKNERGCRCIEWVKPFHMRGPMQCHEELLTINGYRRPWRFSQIEETFLLRTSGLCSWALTVLNWCTLPLNKLESRSLWCCV